MSSDAESTADSTTNAQRPQPPRFDLSVDAVRSTVAPLTPGELVDERPTNIRWMVFALACSTSFLLYLHRYTWNFVAPKLREEYGWSEIQVQGAYSLFYLTYGLGQIPSGVLCDLLGAHLLLGIIIIVWSLATPLQGIPSSAGVSAARLTFGFTQAGCYPVLAKVTQAWFPPTYRTMVQGAVATFFGRCGGALSPIIMATVLMGYFQLSWQVSLMVLSCVGIVFGVLFLFLFRDRPEIDPRVNAAELAHIQQGRLPVAPTETGVRRVMPWGRALRNRSMAVFIALQAIMAGVDSIFSGLLGMYFLSKGTKIAEAGLLASLPLFGGMIGGMLAAWGNDYLLRRIHNRRWARSLVGIFSNTMAAVMMLVVIRQTNLTAAAWGLFGVKFFADMSQPTQWGACTDIGGRHFSATVFGIINTAGNVGGITFPLLFGWILLKSPVIGTISGVEQHDFGPLFVVAAGMYVATAVCWAFIDCTRTLDDA